MQAALVHCRAANIQLCVAVSRTSRTWTRLAPGPHLAAGHKLSLRRGVQASNNRTLSRHAAVVYVMHTSATPHLRCRTMLCALTLSSNKVPFAAMLFASCAGRATCHRQVLQLWRAGYVKPAGAAVCLLQSVPARYHTRLPVKVCSPLSESCMQRRGLWERLVVPCAHRQCCL